MNQKTWLHTPKFFIARKFAEVNTVSLLNDHEHLECYVFFSFKVILFEYPIWLFEYKKSEPVISNLIQISDILAI